MPSQYDEFFSPRGAEARRELYKAALRWRAANLAAALATDGPLLFDDPEAATVFARALVDAARMARKEWTLDANRLPVVPGRAGLRPKPAADHLAPEPRPGRRTDSVVRADLRGLDDLGPGEEFAANAGFAIGAGGRLVMATGRAAPGLPAAIFQIALGDDRFSTMLREALCGDPAALLAKRPAPDDGGGFGGRPPVGGPAGGGGGRPPVGGPGGGGGGLGGDLLPDRPLDLAKVERTVCGRGVASALGELGQQGSLSQVAYTPKIIAIAPTEGCPGTRVVFTGTGFGDPPPAGVGVSFTGRTPASWAHAEVALDPAGARLWSDTSITVIAPPDVGHGPVCISRLVGQTAELSGLVGAMQACFGPAAGAGAAASMHVRPIINRFVGPPFAGGRPLIRHFTANGSSAGATIRPNGMATLSWNVVGATQVRLEVANPQTPASPVGAQAASGTLALGPINLPHRGRAEWRLVAINACGETSAVTRVTIDAVFAWVLSGGGAKGAFQVGAVRCLRDVAQLSPAIVACASAGALNGLKVAENRSASIGELEGLWDQMTFPQDLAIPRPWARTLGRQALTVMTTSGGGGLGFAFIEFLRDNAVDAALTAAGVPSALLILMDAQKYVGIMIEIASAGIALNQMFSSPSIFDFAPVEARIDSNFTAANVSNVANSGVKLRIATVELESGELVVWDERGRRLGDSTGTTIGIIEAAKASASIPVAFPARSVSDPATGYAATLIDGGTRANIPFDLAAAEDPDVILTVLASKQRAGAVGTPPGGWRMIDVAQRSPHIVLDQLTGRMPPASLSREIDRITVEPRLEVYTTLAVDPGLIRIYRDYGYMCAFDEVVADQAQTASVAALKSLADQLVLKRVEIWMDEHRMHRQPHYDTWKFLFPPKSPKPQVVSLVIDEQLTSLRTRKAEVRALAERRVKEAAGGANASRAVPSGAADWWRDWERHHFALAVDLPNPWVSWMDDLGTAVPTASAPPPL